MGRRGRGNLIIGLPKYKTITKHSNVNIDKNAPWYFFVCFLCVSCRVIWAQKKPPFWVAFLLSFQTFIAWLRGHTAPDTDTRLE